MSYWSEYWYKISKILIEILSADMLLIILTAEVRTNEEYYLTGCLEARYGDFQLTSLNARKLPNCEAHFNFIKE